MHGAVPHPLHVRLYPMQLQADHPAINMRPGGWLDVLHERLDDTTVRFFHDTWGGPLVLHCHFLNHEDAWAMAHFEVEGGCNYDLTDYHDDNFMCEDFPTCGGDSPETTEVR